MKSVIKIYIKDMMKILLKCMLVAGGILILVGNAFDGDSFLLLLILMWTFLGMGCNFFSIIILEDYFGRNGSWFLQIPCSKKEKLTALLLTNFTFCLIFFLSLFIIVPYLNAHIEMNISLNISMLVRSVSLAILPIFTVIVSKEVFPKFPNFIMFILFIQAFLGIGFFLESFHILLNCSVFLILDILILYFTYGIFDHHFNAGEKRCL